MESNAALIATLSTRAVTMAQDISPCALPCQPPCLQQPYQLLLLPASWPACTDPHRTHLLATTALCMRLCTNEQPPAPCTCMSYAHDIKLPLTAVTPAGCLCQHVGRAPWHMQLQQYDQYLHPQPQACLTWNTISTMLSLVAAASTGLWKSLLLLLSHTRPSLHVTNTSHDVVRSDEQFGMFVTSLTKLIPCQLT